MAGRGPAPAENRRRRNVPERGEWQTTPGTGWQHGDVPKPPTGLLRASRHTWDVWFHAWFASHWTPEDLPVLRQVIRYYDKVERGDATAAELTQYRQFLEAYGITPKGQQDRRWVRPKEDEPVATTTSESPYRDLRLVREA